MTSEMADTSNPGVISFKRVETTPFRCDRCGAEVIPKNASAGPWDIEMQFQCADAECRRVCIVTFPSQQAVDYKRADSLAPIVEVSVG